MRILTNYNFSGNEIQNVKIQNLATAPASPSKGQVYFNTTNNRLFVWNGDAWIGADANDAVLSGSQIVNAINSSQSKIDDDNLSDNVNLALSKSHDTHTISDVSGLQTALDGKVSNSRVLSDVPIGAIFTDTVTSINGKTGVIAKADIVALGIPAQDTTYLTFTSNNDGLVPMSDGSSLKYLRADGAWVVPPDTIYTLPVAGVNLGGIKSGNGITVDGNGFVTIADDSHNHSISYIYGLQTALDSKETPAGATSKATTAENNAKAYTDTKIADLLSSAPETLDTLNELAAALGNDPNFATTITNQIASKADKYSATVGNGIATSFVVTHNLNSRDVVITIRETASPYAQVITDVEMTTLDTVTVKFASAPTSNQYTITIIG